MALAAIPLGHLGGRLALRRTLALTIGFPLILLEGELYEQLFIGPFELFDTSSRIIKQINFLFLQFLKLCLDGVCV